MVWIGAGVGALAVIAIAAVVFSGGRGAASPQTATDQSRELPHTEALSQPSPDELARRLLEAAAAVAQGNPADFAGAIAAYQKVLSEAGASPLAARAKDAIAQLERRRDEVAAIATRCTNSANALAADGKFDDAIAVWERASAEQGAPLAAAAAHAAADLRAAAEATLAALVAPVEAAMNAGDWAAARTALAAAGQIGYAAARPRLAEFKNRIDASESEAQRAAAAAAMAQATAAMKPIEAAFVAASLRDDIITAQKIVSEATANPGLRIIASRLAAMNDVCAGMARIDALPKAMVQAARDGRPHTFFLNRSKVVGTVSDVSDRSFVLMIKIDAGEGAEAGEAGQHYRYSDFAPAELKRLRAGFHPASAADHLALAIFALIEKDPAAASQELDLAKDHPLADDYRERLDAQQMGEVEAAAKSAWAALAHDAEGQISGQRADRLRDEISAFEAAHGKTKFAASIADKIAALESRLQMVNRLLVLDLGAGVRWRPCCFSLAASRWAAPTAIRSTRAARRSIR